MREQFGTDKTLYEQLKFTDTEIKSRLDLLGFKEEDVTILSNCFSCVADKMHNIVGEFYEQQTSFDEIALVIGDADTLARLKNAQRQYIEDLFHAVVDQEYVNNRLRVGLVHKRIGVSPKLYLASMQMLYKIIINNIRADVKDADLSSLEAALSKLMNFDMALTFDAYISSMMSELEISKLGIEKYAQEVERLSTIDKLTGLMNRNALDGFIKRIYAHAKRAMEPITAMVIDMDKFKYINDEFGHAKGDEVLATMGGILLEGCREDIDIACRLGGDEFLVVMANCKAENALIVHERFTKLFKKTHPKFSFSVGIAETGPEEFMSVDSLLSMADKNMYNNKHNAKKAPQRNTTKRS